MKLYTLKKNTEEKDFKINYKEELNQQQLNVVLNGDGKSLVLAGPGSGKTRTLVYRVAYLLENKVNPENILLLTFTNKASKNMMSRVEELLGYYPKGITGGTFHSIGASLLRRYPEVIGFKPNFSILDNEDSRQIIKDISAKLKPKKEKHFPNTSVIFFIISYCKNAQVPISEYIKKEYSYLVKFTSLIIRISDIYEERKKNSNAMDFDDLLFYWNKLVEKEGVSNYLKEKFKYILVDEFQDTNKIQFSIIKNLTNQDSNILVVGDDCQSIYAFRAAEIKNILDFPAHYKDSKQFKLEINYRSTPEIIDLINHSIKNNKNQFNKNLQPVKNSKIKPSLVHCKDTEQEAEFISQRILDLKEEGLSYNDIGVLFRADFHSANLELELMKRNIPYKKVGGLRFFEQKHIKDMTSFLKILSNKSDELAWKRVLCLFEGIGQVTAISIWTILSKSNNPIELIKKGFKINLSAKAQIGFSEFTNLIIKSAKKDEPAEIINLISDLFYKGYIKNHFPNYKERILDINQYINLVNQYNNLDKFLTDILLDSDLIGSDIKSNTQNEEDGLVTLTTIHKAKGLEWNSVFIISLAENRFPHERAYEEGTIEEERRLFYVACSRAMNELYLCIPMEDTTYWGGFTILKDSEFIQELPENVYEKWTLRDEG